MNRIEVFVVLVLANASILAFAQTKDLKRPAQGKVKKRPIPLQVANYPTMMDITVPELVAAVKKTDIVLLSVGAIEEHGPSLPLATDAIVGVAQLVDVKHYLHSAGIETIVGPTAEYRYHERGWRLDPRRDLHVARQSYSQRRHACEAISGSSALSA
jgi:hypothetical protein